MERETGIEPATSSLGSWRSTAELLPLEQPQYSPANDRMDSALFSARAGLAPAIVSCAALRRRS